MGVPKQKWTAEEEAALIVGVDKHGRGKWRSILSDPEFEPHLRLRSNVDLKDKWRNINMPTEWGSKQVAQLAVSRALQAPGPNENSKGLSSGEGIVLAEPLASCSGTQKYTDPKPPKRLEILIFEAITALKEPCGSDGASIALYIKEKHWAPPKLKPLLLRKLNLLVAYEKLILVNHKYKIADNATVSEGVTRPVVPKPERRKLKFRAKCRVGGGAALEAAVAAAAEAVAAAEAAMAEAEAAAREAEALEAEAEAAQVFAEAAMKLFLIVNEQSWANSKP